MAKYTQKDKRKRKSKVKTKKRLKCFDYKPKNFIFGYGSLISSESRIYTGKGYIGDPIPIEISKKMGYIRVWTCKPSKMGNMCFLAMQKSKKATNIQGVICPIFKCIENFDKREKGYKRIKIKINTPAKRKMIKALSWQSLPNYPFNIYIYTINDCLSPSKKCSISQRYLDVVMSGCLEYGIKFTKHFLKQTFNWTGKNKKVFWKNDRGGKNPRKYDLKYINYSRIDKILKEVIPEYFKMRK